MASVDVLSSGGGKAGTVELPDEVFGVQVNVPVMHRVVRAQLAAARAGTHSTKTRAEVRGGGKKPWRQKGTGRARQGSIRAPQWTGGGVAFGPKPRDHSMRINKKEKVLALRSALTDRLAGGNLVVLESLDFEEPQTRRAVELIEALELSGRQLLFVVDGLEEAAIKSLRNLPTVHLLTFDQLNTYDVLASDAVVFTRDSLDAFLGRAATPDADDELVLEDGPSAGGSGGLAGEARAMAPGPPSRAERRPPVDTGSGGFSSEAQNGASGGRSRAERNPPVDAGEGSS